VLSTNTRSIVNKLNELAVYATINSVDIFGITETHLSIHLPDSLISLNQQYRVFRKDRNRYGGGICLLIRKDLPGIEICKLDIPSQFNEAEILAVDIVDTNNSLSLRVVVCYRPPGNDTDSNWLFFNTLDFVCNSCARVCIMGDLNLPEFDWHSLTHPCNALYNAAADFVCYNGLSQFITEPTRSNNILDVVLCSDVLGCEYINMHPPSGNSDHNTAVFEVNLSLPIYKDASAIGLVSTNYSKADWDGINSYLANCNWNVIFADCADVNQY